MSEPFDPYYCWLGIPPEHQPPHYYRLLGIEPLESDPNVIEAAADERITRLRTYQTGMHAELSEDLINQVTAAKVMLLDPEKKAPYDRALADELKLRPEVESPQKPLPVAQPLPPYPQPPLAQPPVSGVQPFSGRPRSHGQKSPWVVPAIVGVGVLAVVALVVVLLLRDRIPQVAQGENQTEQGAGSAEQQTQRPAPLPPIGDRPTSPDTPPSAEDTPGAAGSGREPAAGEEAESDDPSVPAEPQVPAEPGERPPDARGEGSLAELLELDGEPLLAPGDVQGTELAQAPLPNVPKAPVPDAAAQQKALALIRDVFKDDYDRAETAAGKAALAAKMLQQVNQPGTDAVARFVLLRVARDVAAEAGDVETAFWAIDRIAASYAVDPVPMRSAAWLRAAEAAILPEHRKAVAQRSIPMIREAVARDDYPTAERLAELATRVVRNLRDAELVKQIVALSRQVKQTEDAYGAIQPALATLKTNPNDPEANLAAGGFFCLVKGDWRKGIPMLASASDAGLAAVARKELNSTGSTKEQLDLGDAWWNLAQAKQAQEKESCMLRAGYWYEQAEANLTPGLAKLKAQKRLAEIAKLGRPIPEDTDRRPPLAIAPFDEKEARAFQVQWSQHLEVPVVQTNSIGMKIVLIPAGEFLMGSPQSEQHRLPHETQHRVRITRPFYLGAHEVTMGQFQQFVTAAGYRTDAEKDGKGGFCFDRTVHRWTQKPEYSWRNSGASTRDNHPVVNVTWNDAVAFCEWLGRKEGNAYRLPTEAEWEYACRAGLRMPFLFGGELNGREANCDGNHPYGTRTKGRSLGQALKVDSYRPNGWGLYHMHGNVWEWCSDWYGAVYYSSSPLADPVGPSSGSNRVARGGSWNSYCASARSAHRNSFTPDFRRGDSGFRVCRTVPSVGRSPADIDPGG